MTNVTYRIPVRNNRQDSRDALPGTPGIGNVLGAIVDGQQISINGFGFGTAGTIAAHARGDEGVHNAPIHGSVPFIGSALDTFMIGSGDDTSGAFLRFSSTRSRGRRQRVMRRRHSNDSSAYAAGGFGVTGFPTDEVYVSFWSYDYIPNWVADSSNYKKFYSFGLGTSDMPQAMLFVPAQDNRWGFYQNIGDGTLNYSDRNNINTKGWTVENTVNQWVFWECWFKLNSAPGAYDGSVRVKRNGELGIVNDSWRASDVTQLYHQLYLGYMDQGMDAACTFDFTDVLIATKPSRVVLGDNPTWEFCAHRETQFTRSEDWADNFIVSTVNLGAFNVTAGSTLYLYIINSQDVPVSVTGFPVTVAS